METQLDKIRGAEQALVQSLRHFLDLRMFEAPFIIDTVAPLVVVVTFNVWTFILDNRLQVY